MFILNTLIQLVGVVAGIYIAITESIGKGVLLVVIVLVMHAIFTQLSNFLMYLHQKTLAKEDLHHMALMAQIGRGNEAAPVAWKVISYTCGVLFFVSASIVIYLFVGKIV
ncbi:hypothetical protein [Methylicorpusculum sp.]|uniref:hypothetical protein n=1 Tax=Methylicorpusculum sp. TaxID=2713644 RepID=UPI0027314AE0|nr:hypothetical protein [Methylicorpusculum sp.]MDP2178301.1 hypothetical protein [Methylicorpusculum sp.]MDP3531093.1 hypothetical protein [Methylicorpusculum sp.]MDZ4151760.1 hypothetical protein [Methylicorpusculum sp.]